jgi:hypothetical protein
MLYDFKNIFVKKIDNKLAFLTQSLLNCSKIGSWFFRENANFFGQKSANIPEISDQ